MRDFIQLWNSTASYSVLASSCYYLNLLLFTCYTVSSLEMHKKIHGCPLSNLDSKSELQWGGTAELSQQLRTGPHAAISAGHYLARWPSAEPATLHLAYHPSGKSDLNYWYLKCLHTGAFHWEKGSGPRVWVWSCLVFFIFLLSQNCTWEDKNEHGTGISQEHKERDFSMTA